MAVGTGTVLEGLGQELKDEGGSGTDEQVQNLKECG